MYLEVSDVEMDLLLRDPKVAVIEALCVEMPSADAFEFDGEVSDDHEVDVPLEHDTEHGKHKWDPEAEGPSGQSGVDVDTESACDDAMAGLAEINMDGNSSKRDRLSSGGDSSTSNARTSVADGSAGPDNENDNECDEICCTDGGDDGGTDKAHTNDNDDNGSHDECNAIHAGESRTASLRGHMFSQGAFNTNPFSGNDGEKHRFFNLPVVYEPYRTGFENYKDLDMSVNTVIAGR